MDNPTEKLLKNMLTALSAYENKKRSEAIKQGIARRRATGRLPHSTQKINSTRR